MIKFDRIKISTKASYVSDLNPMIVVHSTNPNIIKQNFPFNLFIQKKLYKNEAIIEFSSKILLDNYSELITKNTITECFENIVKLGFCKLDIEKIIYDSKLLSCDITHDLDEIVLPKDFRLILIANLKNISGYTVRKYINCGYTVSNLLKTKHLKVRFSIYNKFKEIYTAPNKGFRNMLADPTKLMNYFKGKYRFEANVKNFRQINEYCGTKGNSLIDVLNTDKNPLLSIFDDTFSLEGEKPKNMVTNNASIFDFESINQLRDALLLKECGNDLNLVKEVLNGYYSPKTNKRKYIKNYKKILNDSPHHSQNRLMIGQIRDKLIA